MALDFKKEGAKAISAPVAARLGRSEQEVLDVIEQARPEWDTLQTRGYGMIAYGQKPPAGSFARGSLASSLALVWL